MHFPGEPWLMTENPQSLRPIRSARLEHPHGVPDVSKRCQMLRGPAPFRSGGFGRLVAEARGSRPANAFQQEIPNPRRVGDAFDQALVRGHDRAPLLRVLRSSATAGRLDRQIGDTEPTLQRALLTDTFWTFSNVIVVS